MGGFWGRADAELFYELTLWLCMGRNETLVRTTWIRSGRGRRNVADGDHTVGTVGFVFAVGVSFGKAVHMMERS